MIRSFIMIAGVMGLGMMNDLHSIAQTSVTLPSKKQKEVSVNELKETIGSLLDEVNDCCSSLLTCYSGALGASSDYNNQISSLLQDNAQLQKSISKQVKLLIENKKPYKKATRIQLQAKVTSLTSCKERLQEQIKGWDAKIALLKNSDNKKGHSEISSYALSCHNELKTIQKSSLFTEEHV